MTSRIPGFAYDSKTHKARFEVILPGTNGRTRKRKWTTCATRAEALTAWKTFQDEARQPRTPTLTLGAYIQEYWPVLCRRVSKRTARDETYMLKHLAPLATTPLDRCNTAVLRDLIGTLKQRAYSPATINAVTGLFVRLLRDAVERDILPAFPIRGRVPKQKVPLLRLELTEDEEARFLAACDDEYAFRRYLEGLRGKHEAQASPHYTTPRRFGDSILPHGAAAAHYFERFRDTKPLWIIALRTGLRRGDLLDLRWRDLHEGWIVRTVRKTKTVARIPLCNDALAAIDDLARRGPTRAEDYVLRSSDGEPYALPTILRYFALAKRLAGITRRCRLHDLRHTYASRLASAGVSLQVIAESMAHTTSRCTARYAKPDATAALAITQAFNSRRGAQ